MRFPSTGDHATHRMDTVLLQAMKEQPPADAKCKDKFLVQSVAITGDLSFSNITSIVCICILCTLNGKQSLITCPLVRECAEGCDTRAENSCDMVA
jgi:hypothetical protein